MQRRREGGCFSRAPPGSARCGPPPPTCRSTRCLLVFVMRDLRVLFPTFDSAGCNLHFKISATHMLVSFFFNSLFRRAFKFSPPLFNQHICCCFLRDAAKVIIGLTTQKTRANALKNLYVHVFLR